MSEQFDDRVRPLLLAQADTRDAGEWNYEDAEQVIARLLARIDELQGPLSNPLPTNAAETRG